MAAAQRYRGVQWATGNTGQRALREVIRDPWLDLVGVLVYDTAKDGVDAGKLCGEGPTGGAAPTDPPPAPTSSPPAATCSPEGCGSATGTGPGSRRRANGATHRCGPAGVTRGSSPGPPP